MTGVVTTSQYLGTAPVTVTGSRDFTNEDNGFILVYSGAGAITLTIPLTLNAGFGCAVSQLGAGQVTIAGATGVTLHNYSAQVSTAGQYAAIAVIDVGTNSYVVTGQTG